MGNKKKDQPGTSSISTMSSTGIPNIHGIHTPAPLDTKTNTAENWKTFKESWENYSIIMNIKPEAFKVVCSSTALAKKQQRSLMASYLG